LFFHFDHDYREDDEVGVIMMLMAIKATMMVMLTSG